MNTTSYTLNNTFSKFETIFDETLNKMLNLQRKCLDGDPVCFVKSGQHTG